MASLHSPELAMQSPYAFVVLLAAVPSVAFGRPTTSDYGGCYHAVDRPAAMPLQDIIDDVGPTGVLIVDQTCTVDTDLILPDRFTLKGPSWAGAGILDIVGGHGISFDGGGDDEAHSTLEALYIQGPGTGTALLIEHRHQIQLRDLTVSGFDVGVLGDHAYSVDIDHCNFNQNGVGISLGTEANTWRIRGGLCSQNQLCMDLHPGGDGNDTMVLGVRMESNKTAVRVGGLSSYVSFNRFEGNSVDVDRLPTASGLVLLANNMATGTVSDLSELSDGVLTGLPDLDQTLRLGIVDGYAPTAQLFTGYVPGNNLLRTQLLSNQLTEDGITIDEGYSDGYAGWQLELDGSTVDATSMVRLSYRGPGQAGPPVEVLRVGADGIVHATEFVADSDARLKENIAPVQSALSRISRLRGVQYDWSNGAATGQPSMGLLASDVEAVFPSAVDTREDGMQAVHYDQLTAPIVESIKELVTENERLRADLKRVQDRVDELSQR